MLTIQLLPLRNSDSLQPGLNHQHLFILGLQTACSTPILEEYEGKGKQILLVATFTLAYVDMPEFSFHRMLHRSKTSKGFYIDKK
ncbi:hypothetical protein VNO77_30088 [Canavalia gladiata]|uniref:Uncharacterized protein n=1 Tax=Canavalia gladiata TaxID=3824 RepID=A0AAN9KQQ7_CANGL